MAKAGEDYEKVFPKISKAGNIKCNLCNGLFCYFEELCTSLHEYVYLMIYEYESY